MVNKNACPVSCRKCYYKTIHFGPREALLLHLANNHMCLYYKTGTYCKKTRIVLKVQLWHVSLVKDFFALFSSCSSPRTVSSCFHSVALNCSVHLRVTCLLSCRAGCSFFLSSSTFTARSASLSRLIPSWVEMTSIVSWEGANLNMTKLSLSWRILASTWPVMGGLGQVLVEGSMVSAVLALVAVSLFVAVVHESLLLSGVLNSKIFDNWIHETKEVLLVVKYDIQETKRWGKYWNDCSSSCHSPPLSGKVEKVM